MPHPVDKEQGRFVRLVFRRAHDGLDSHGGAPWVDGYFVFIVIDYVVVGAEHCSAPHGFSKVRKILTRIMRKGELREFFIEFCENSPNLRLSR
jgi:hypothetical protein